MPLLTRNAGRVPPAAIASASTVVVRTRLSAHLAGPLRRVHVADQGDPGGVDDDVRGLDEVPVDGVGVGVPLRLVAGGGRASYQPDDVVPGRPEARRRGRNPGVRRLRPSRSAWASLPGTPHPPRTRSGSSARTTEDRSSRMTTGAGGPADAEQCQQTTTRGAPMTTTPRRTPTLLCVAAVSRPGRPGRLLRLQRPRLVRRAEEVGEDRPSRPRMEFLLDSRR